MNRINQPETIQPRYGDTKSISATFGIPEATLTTERCRGGGPPFRKVGRKVLYSFEEVAAWIDQGRRRSTSDDGACR